MAPPWASADAAQSRVTHANMATAWAVRFCLRDEGNPFTVSSRQISLCILNPGGHRKVAQKVRLCLPHFQVEVDLGAFVELADGLSVALATFVLGVDFVVDRGGE